MKKLKLIFTFLFAMTLVDSYAEKNKTSFYEDFGERYRKRDEKYQNKEHDNYHVKHLNDFLSDSERRFKEEYKTLYILLKDLDCYKLSDKQFREYNKEMFHPYRFDLLSHSVVTAQNVCNSGRVDNINPEIDLSGGLESYYLELAYYAALLHDIGKAGWPYYRDDLDNGKNSYYFDIRNKIVTYVTKPDYARRGFEYIVNSCYGLNDEDSKNPKRTWYGTESKYVRQYRGYYKTTHWKNILFDRIFISLGLSVEEQKIIAVLVGNQEFFNQIYLEELYKDKEKSETEIVDKFTNLYTNVVKLFDEVGLNKGKYLNEKLFKMMNLLSLSDLFANYFFADRKNDLPIFHCCINLPLRRKFKKGEWEKRELFCKLALFINRLRFEQFLTWFKKEKEKKLNNSGC